MEIAVNIIELLDAEMTEPQPYGWFHWLWIFITGVSTVLLCKFFKPATAKPVIALVLVTSVVVALLEIYKQLSFTFSVSEGKIVSDYQWYAFPFQFCSTPMYIGLLAGIFRKGKLHEALCAYLASFAVVAGIIVMLVPTTVFVGTIGINIQTMVCHGSMIVIGVYLLYTGYVKTTLSSLLKAVSVFAACFSLAILMNELVYLTGFLDKNADEFNMFFVSRHCDPSLPVFSSVQAVVPYPVSLVIYVLAFTAMAAMIIYGAKLVKRVALFTVKS